MCSALTRETTTASSSPRSPAHFAQSGAGEADSLSPLPAILADARRLAGQEGLPFAGSVSPEEAWALVQAGAATLVDVRTGEERKFVGQVPDTLHVAWATGTSLNRNPRFVKELEAKVRKDQAVLLLCRSGKRSALAAEAATKAGFSLVFNVREGFEGELNEDGQRGSQDGWRFRRLPWFQD